MPAYKYKLKDGRIKWYALFYYTDWMGTLRRHCKRGFDTQRDAREYERLYLSRQGGRSDIMFPALVDNYMEDIGNRLRPTTMENKRHLINTKILPYFQKKKVCDIDALMVRNWQNELMRARGRNGQAYSGTYLKTIHNQLSAIMNYAVKHYGLPSNPCRAAGAIGSARAGEMNIWTLDQYNLFRSYLDTSRMRLAFDLLFYTGMRDGELLALTPADFLGTGEVRICKTYVRIHGEERVQPPKTKRGNRTVSLPATVHKEATDYIGMLYGIQPDDRIFDFTKQALENRIINLARKAGLPRIRVHDLRHSHASMLIDMGVDIMVISRRLGHESTKTTWDTYGHLYPDKGKNIADDLGRFIGGAVSRE